MTDAASAAVSRLLGVPAVNVRPVGGQVRRVAMPNQAPVAAKRHDEPSAVAAEAASLRWLATDAVPVPAVLATDEDWLITEFVDEDGAPSAAAAEALGRGLARLHAAGAEAFGSPPPGGPADAWIGLAPMRNRTAVAWPEWFAEHRIVPYLRIAVDAHAMSGEQAALVERVCARIGELAGPPEPPARLHGDLWSGNVLWHSDGAWLVDPAAHGGHRESDLAMLQWLSCPYLDRVLAAYDETEPLADGWRARVPLHQLFPQLVHAALFGSGYGRIATASARAALRI